MPHRVRSPDDPTARMRLAARAGKLTVLQRLSLRDLELPLLLCLYSVSCPLSASRRCSNPSSVVRFTPLQLQQP